MTFTEPKPKAEKMTLEKFRQILFWVLAPIPNGSFYATIQSKAPALPKKSPPIWVNRLEETGWLERQVDPATHRKISKLRTRELST
jgi:hypothetical protein